MSSRVRRRVRGLRNDPKIQFLSAASERKDREGLVHYLVNDGFLSYDRETCLVRGSRHTIIRGSPVIEVGLRGAEKSCRSRRRKRGLRSGRRRSRGGKPRRTATLPAPVSTSRRVSSAVRFFEFYDARISSLIEKCRRSPNIVVRNPMSSVDKSSFGPGYFWFRTQWRLLHKGVMKKQDHVYSRACLSNGPQQFLEERLGVILPGRRELKAFTDFDDLLTTLRLRDDTPRVPEKVQVQGRCKYCGVRYRFDLLGTEAARRRNQPRVGCDPQGVCRRRKVTSDVTSPKSAGALYRENPTNRNPSRGSGRGRPRVLPERK